MVCMQYTDEELQRLSDRFEGKDPVEVLSWAHSEFGDRIALATSFGAEGAALIDMVLRVAPTLKIFYLDTDLLFEETYQTRDNLAERYNMTFITQPASLSLKEQDARYGEHLWERDPDLCCYLRKVKPLKQILQPLDAWMTAIRRDQSPTRANIGVVERDKKFGLIKVNPLACWNGKQVWRYIVDRNIPYNPLHDQGYPSIGCWPCTTAVIPGEDPRAGRWRGSQKKECGLHT
ncbi:MAG: phosphoadenylyl-sulfate reductase [Candidatus Latescibacteria bacterium]|nr:phosphoadenylyl-sulfate reductase [Candidatus Latescibacterota bacterium]